MDTRRSLKATTKRIILDFKKYNFVPGKEFSWSGSRQAITYHALTCTDDLWQLLHEVAHAELKHSKYLHDVQLMRMEAAAWHYAKATLAPQYDTAIVSDFIEDSLDTYRQWLHGRSLCPRCQQTGVQEQENTYSCLNCRCSWRVNEARLCGVRRVLKRQ